MTAFFGHNSARGSGAGGGGGGGGGGGRQDEPKADQKIVISCRVLRNNYLEDGYSRQYVVCTHF